jgi:death on curing protein
MTEFIMVDIEQVIYIHERIIDQASGIQGVRDYPLLHSALERCKATFSGQDLYPDTLTKAAALMHSLVMNHAFVDGNKRTAWQVTKRLLYINGFKIKATQAEIVDFCVAIDNRGWKVKQILSWFKDHTQSIRVLN